MRRLVKRLAALNGAKPKGFANALLNTGATHPVALILLLPKLYRGL